MLAALLCAIGLAAPAARVVYEIGPEGVTVRSVTRHELFGAFGAADGALGALEVLDGDRVLARVGLDDPRVRTVITPEGGEVARLDRALGRVDVPWADGARLRVGTRFVDPGMAPPPTNTEGVVAVQAAGDPTQRLDLVFLGDGYRAEDMDVFADDVDRVVAYLASIEPWSRYATLLNVWRVEIPSVASGASHDELGTVVDTAFECAYGCGDIDRLICCDEGKVLDAAARVGAYDGVMVLVNDPTYGGSGGFTYATAYTGLDFGTQVAAHELGHSLVLLHDEYSYGFSDNFSATGPNCTKEPEAPQWDQWLGVDGVDAFQECSYTNHWRPTAEGCMMRTLSDGYCPVCREEAVLAMYGKIPDIVTSATPSGTVEEGAIIEIATVIPADDLVFEWTVDGAPIEGVTGATFDPTCTGVNGEVSVRIVDATPWVREDPQDLLASSAGPWTVASEDCAPVVPKVGDCEGCSSVHGAVGWWALALVPWLRRRRA